MQERQTADTKNITHCHSAGPRNPSCTLPSVDEKHGSISRAQYVLVTSCMHARGVMWKMNISSMMWSGNETTGCQPAAYNCRYKAPSSSCQAKDTHDAVHCLIFPPHCAAPWNKQIKSVFPDTNDLHCM